MKKLTSDGRVVSFWRSGLFSGACATLLLPLSAFAEAIGQLPAAGQGAVEPGNAMAAMSPLKGLPMGAVGATLLVGILVTILLVGGLLIVNLGLMSKREEDRIGSRDPSDVGILKHNTWPHQPQSKAVFPAVDEDEEVVPGEVRAWQTPVQVVSIREARVDSETESMGGQSGGASHGRSQKSA